MLKGWLRTLGMGVCTVGALSLPAHGEIRVRVGDIAAPDFVTDPGTDGGTTQKVVIVGCRNGSFSGKVVVSSEQAIEDLTVRVSDLVSGRHTIPSPAVQVRYAREWGSCYVYGEAGAGLTPTVYRKDGLIGLLADSPPQVCPVRKVEVARQTVECGPVVPVWLTVRIPKDAQPDVYTAQVRISAKGGFPRELPLEVKVVDWTLPDPDRWRTWVDVIQSPDTLALEYGERMWSERHWELIGTSMRWLRLLGNRIVYIPLICRTNMGNEQSMVRWVKQKDGTRRFDFSVLERYLDTALREMGAPRIVVLYVWDNYMIKPGEAGTGAAAMHEQERILELMAKEGLVKGTGPAVTLVDGETGETTTEYLDRYGEGTSRQLWQEVFARIREILKSRGLERAGMLGMIDDCWPTRAEVEFLAEVSGKMPWVIHAHFTRPTVYDVVPAGYRAQVWSIKAPETTSLFGWRRPDLLARFNRATEFGDIPVAAWRLWPEYCITGDQRGVSRLGADFWQVIKDRQGRRSARVWERYPESTWRNLGIYTSLLGPGEEGPSPTVRYELFREGLQECEARIRIEEALSSADIRQKIGEDLAGRCKEELDRRIASFRNNRDWNLGAGAFDNRQRLSKMGADEARQLPLLGESWMEAAHTLFRLASEVTQKLGGT